MTSRICSFRLHDRDRRMLYPTVSARIVLTTSVAKGSRARLKPANGDLGE